MKMTTQQKKFTAWCEATELTRKQTAAVLGCDLRTIYRYLSGTTEPHGGVMRLLEVFTRFPDVQAEMIAKHTH
jgi:transcriptional regulator with XRE-family HTH domain